MSSRVHSHDGRQRVDFQAHAPIQGRKRKGGAWATQALQAYPAGLNQVIVDMIVDAVADGARPRPTPMVEEARDDRALPAFYGDNYLLVLPQETVTSSVEFNTISSQRQRGGGGGSLSVIHYVFTCHSLCTHLSLTSRTGIR